jgi:outer membrane protein assembly factor BamB
MTTYNHINAPTNELFVDHRYPDGYQRNIFVTKLYDATQEQNTIQKKPSINPESSGKWPMDSPWPMYSHDVRHTGLSPYNTTDNPLTEKWRFPLSLDNFYSGFILDCNGTIYGASYYIYGIYPNGTEKWRYYIGESESTPAIDVNGVLYIGTIWGGTNYLHAIYSRNGTQKWQYSVGNDIDSSPVIGADGTIYFGDWSGYVHAVSPDGTRKWRYHTGDVITSSPAIGNDGTIYIGSHDDYVYAFYPNGTVKWRFQTGAWVHSSPTIGPDGTIYIGSDDSYLYALNSESGSMIWRCHLAGGTWCSPTVNNNGMLYLGTYDMKFHAINPNGTIKWTYDAPGRIWFGSSATVSSDGTIYFGTTTQDGGSGALIALNPDGTERFRDNYGYYATSPAIGDDGTVYAASFNYAGKNGHLHAFGRGALRADAGGPYSAHAGEPFTVSEDIYGGTPPYTCHWDFGDGNTSNERHPTHIYTTASQFNITFTVTDSEHNTSTDHTTITTTYGPPYATLVKPVEGIYVMDKWIRPWTGGFLIIGPITFIVNASHPVGSIDRVEFYADGKLRAIDRTPPYTWVWRRPYLLNWYHGVYFIVVSTVGTDTERDYLMWKIF